MTFRLSRRTSPRRLFPFATAATLALALGLASTLQAAPREDPHDQHQHGQDAQGHHSEHGGTVAETDHHAFEVVIGADGLQVYPMGVDLARGVVAGLKARAYFLLPGAKQYTAPYELQPVATTEGGPVNALALDADLSGLPAEGTRVTIQVWKLPNPAEKTAQFTLPFALGAPAEIVAVSATEDDRLGVSAQATCPVSGQDLNAMGGPIRVTRGEDDRLYLCCRGCLPKVEAAPDRRFGSVISARKATEADRETVAAQGTCPISAADLNAMGGPIKVSRGEKSVFVCCPACIPAVKEKSETYLGAASGETGDEQGHDHDDGPRG
ncbi:hypothetical protein [Tautonia marina]|uniref:hypothetical protein n=1 Tax=Tautonia marina TaxID=2653855 RepID=UPI00126128B4|nr:hypothetical protein [Tautonia marina]